MGMGRAIDTCTHHFLQFSDVTNEGERVWSFDSTPLEGLEGEIANPK